jgi:hypothetical protein
MSARTRLEFNYWVGLQGSGQTNYDGLVRLVTSVTAAAQPYLTHSPHRPFVDAAVHALQIPCDTEQKKIFVHHRDTLGLRLHRKNEPIDWQLAVWERQPAEWLAATSVHRALEGEGTEAAFALQLLVGVRDAAATVLRARRIPQRAVDLCADLVGEGVNPRHVRVVAIGFGRQEAAPDWLIDHIGMLLRTGRPLPPLLGYTIRKLTEAHLATPFTPTQVEVVTGLLGDGLDVDRAVAATRQLCPQAGRP